MLEVPNKSSNILNTFGLSKSHRSGNPSPRAAPACRVLFAALALAISHARAHAAQELRLLQPLLYTTAVALLSSPRKQRRLVAAAEAREE